jgi:hypothetical protein
MSRYDVITFVWNFDVQAFNKALTPPPGLPNGFFMPGGHRYQGILATPPELIAAVNAALAAGATLVGGVSISPYVESFKWVFSQAVLYPPPVKVLAAASALEAGPPAEDGAAGGAAGSDAAV